MSRFAGIAPEDRQAEPLLDRIAARIVLTDAGCWQWQGSLDGAGYGRIFIGSRKDQSRRNALAHRVAYEQAVGPVPDGLDLDHLCRNPACCNPAHLEPVSRAENLRRAPTQPSTINAAKTHCKRGHEFTPENTWLDKKGKRYCRACRKVRGS